MIYLFVMLLGVASPDGQGWHDGRYSKAYQTYTTIAACESARTRSIIEAKRRATETLISKCAAEHDIVEFRSFSADAPTPAVSREGA